MPAKKPLGLYAGDVEGFAVGDFVDIPFGGTGGITKLAAFNNLSPLTTKGDVLISDGTNNIRIGIGPDLSMLTADSTQVSGMRWGSIPMITSRRQVFTANINTGVIVPFYQDPANVYTNTACNNLISLIKKYQKVPVFVVLNPASGPGSAVNANYTALISRLQGAGATVLGYVASGFATGRTLAAITGDVDLWRTFYPKLDSIFVDQMANTAGNEQFYVNIKKYCNNYGLFPVVSNPGAALPQSYFDAGSSDIYMIYENSGYPTEATISGNYGGGYADYNYNNRAAIVYGAPFDVVNLNLLRKYFGLVYATEAVLPNPYAVNSTYLESILSSLSYQAGGASNWVSIPISIPYSTTESYSTTVVVAGVTTTSIVACNLVGGDQNSEIEAEDMADWRIIATPNNGSITFTIFSVGQFGGPVNVIYLVQQS